MSADDIALGLLINALLSTDNNVTKVNCKCGKLMDKKIIKTDSASFVCDGCRRRMRYNEYIYQCPKLNQSIFHPNGYDYCEDCAVRVSKYQNGENVMIETPNTQRERNNTTNSSIMYEYESKIEELKKKMKK